MKIKNLLLVALLAIGLVSCSNDENLPNDQNGDGVKGYMTLSIQNPTLTRTVGSKVEEGTKEESKVANVHVILTDFNGNVVHVLKPSLLEGTNTTVAQEVEIGKYHVYALINAPEGMIIEKNTPIGRVIKGVTEEQAKTGYSGGKFVMINEQNEEGGSGGIAITIEATHTKDRPAKATIPVDRIAVKIVDNTEKDDIKIIDQNGYPLNDILGKIDEYKGYVLINGNTSFNLIQKWEKDEKDEKIRQLALETPTGSYYNLRKEFGKNNEDLTLGKKGIFNTGSVYTIENRPPFMVTSESETITSGKNETTGVIYHLVVNDSITFYIYKGLKYNSIEELNKHADFGDLSEDALVVDLRKKGIKVYENGNMYYTYYIQDQNYTVDYNNEKQKYNAVMRNSVYNPKIKSLSDLGDDIPGGGVDPENPNPPIVQDKAYIQITVQVNPWILNNIAIEF